MEKIHKADIKKINNSKFLSELTIKDNNKQISLKGLKLKNYIAQRMSYGKTISQIKKMMIEKCYDNLSKERGKKIIKAIEEESNNKKIILKEAVKKRNLALLKYNEGRKNKSNVRFGALQKLPVKEDNSSTGSFAGNKNTNSGFAGTPKKNSIANLGEIGNSKGSKPLGF